MTRAWHFVADTLRDGSPIPKDGEWLRYTGRLEMCAAGLHASIYPFDALQYAPGPVLCLVDCDGEIVRGDDKLVCSARRIVARMDSTEMLRYFARMQALSVVHLWEERPQDVVLDYLATGDESIRAAASDAASDAASAAACDAARAAARAAAWAAASDAASAAAWDAAWDAARQDFNTIVRDCFSDYL